MGVKLVLYSQLKNADLHCISAYETVTSFLKCEDVTSLKRYIKWVFEFDCGSEAEAKAQLQRILDQSFYVINPNKESYILDDQPSSSRFSLCVSVQKKVANEDKAICETIVRQLGVDLKKVSKYVFWDIGLLDGSDKVKQHVVDTVVTGFLINPLFEVAEWT